MSETTEAEAKPKPSWHTDRASARTDAEREEHFQAWLVKQQPYVAAIEAAGDKPWFSSEDERRERFYRRYRRPVPPTI